MKPVKKRNLGATYKVTWHPLFTKTFIHFDIVCLNILYSHAGSLFVSCFIVSGLRWIMSQKHGWLITIQRCWLMHASAKPQLRYVSDLPFKIHFPTSKENFAWWIFIPKWNQRDLSSNFDLLIYFELQIPCRQHNYFFM